MVLTQKVDTDTFCLLVFPLKTSLSIAEQACQQLMQQLNIIESPQLGIPDISGLRLRQAVTAGSGSWQDELFQLEAGSNAVEHLPADPAADSAKKTFWYQVF